MPPRQLVIPSAAQRSRGIPLRYRKAPIADCPWSVQGVGIATGEGSTEGDALAAGDGAAGSTKSARNVFKAGLLITNVPSGSSVRAIAVPSGEEPPTVNLW